MDLGASQSEARSAIRRFYDANLLLVAEQPTGVRGSHHLRYLRMALVAILRMIPRTKTYYSWSRIIPTSDITDYSLVGQIRRYDQRLV